MTNYLTSVGVQAFSITIPTGATSATATITAVGSGAFIPATSDNTNQTTGNAATGAARVTLTNSTTVTATRNTSSGSDTITVNGVVVDGDTTNLIASVQFGTITIASLSASNTGSISAVTNNNAAIFYLGSSSSNAASYVTGADYAVVSLSGTTVTATRGSTTSNTTLTVGFCVVEFQGASLQSAVQNIAYNATANVGSVANTITSVTANNTMLAWGGWGTGLGVGTANSRAYATLTNATTVTFTWNAASLSARIINCCVIEFVAGVLNSNAHRGTISLTAATSNTATITSVNTATTIPNWLGNSASSGATVNITKFMQALTNATTVTDTVQSAATGIGSYEVIEFPAFSSGGVFTPYYYQNLIGGMNV